ncbi:nucleoid-associated protein [Acinetobacter haemolyticus]|uniref:nucleoid-associated protein n=1 Tax=Acinetobacter haemolyticus TaxID=29430 RepID=UPI0024DEF2D5|nr:nucleoid-associated protein [Acinetobacter haemolyticus]
MSDFKFGTISKLVLHLVGNKAHGDGVSYSDIQKDINCVESDIIKLLERNFKFDDLYQFYFSQNINLNPIYNFASSIFDRKDSFYEGSKDIARFLYENSVHPQIKPGELCCIYIEECKFKNINVDCLVIFKSEEKEKILKIDNSTNGMIINSLSGIGLNKIQKGCLIIKMEKDSGYIVSLVNDLNSRNVKYWNDDFLKIKRINSEYSHTSNFLNFTKSSIDDYNFENISSKVDILNKSLSYIEERDVVNKDNFYKDVLKDKSLIDCFEKKEDKFFEENFVEFNVSKVALKRQKNKMKKIIKLDNNISILVKQESDNIESGLENGRKFYKIFYEKEE